MTTSENPNITTTAGTPQCPAWCRIDHSTNSSSDEMRVHVREVGSHVEVSALEQRGQIGAAGIYLPNLDQFGDDLTPEQAAHLGQSLLQAVAIIDNSLAGTR